MAFEKMTAKDLFNKLTTLLPNTFGFWEGAASVITKYSKIGARMLRIEMATGLTVYFLWYDDTNWNLGTKPYRNRPLKQQYARMRKKLKTEDTFCKCKEQVENLPQSKEENERGNFFNRGLLEGMMGAVPIDDVFSSWEMLNRTAEQMQNEPLKPIDWVKEEPVLAHDIPDPDSNDPQNYIFGQ